MNRRLFLASALPILVASPETPRVYSFVSRRAGMSYAAALGMLYEMEQHGILTVSQRDGLLFTTDRECPAEADYLFLQGDARERWPGATGA